MFSRALAKTLPLVSEAIQDGESDGKTSIIGPTTSPEASAVTQLSSSTGTPSSSGFEAVVSSFDELSPNFSSVSTRFLFFAFLSPLKDSGLTILKRWMAGLDYMLMLRRARGRKKRHQFDCSARKKLKDSMPLFQHGKLASQRGKKEELPLSLFATPPQKTFKFPKVFEFRNLIISS